jgi:hypothetical protein
MFEAIVICTAQELQLINENLGGDYELGCDITLVEPFTPIGPTDHSQFTGSFDGRGYTISGLEVNQPNDEFMALFAYIEGGSVHRLTVQGEVTGLDYVSLLCASAEGGAMLVDCHAIGTATGRYKVSLVCGVTPFGMEDAVEIRYCTGAGLVDALYGQSGGVAGQIDGVMSDCRFDGTVRTKIGPNIGGVIGIQKGNLMERCYATGSLIDWHGPGTQQMAGIAANFPTGLMVDCGAAVTLEGFIDGHALVGYQGQTVIVASSWDNDLHPTGSPAGDGDGVAGYFPPVQPVYCPADLDRDGLVGITDFLASLNGGIDLILEVLAAWGGCEYD